MARKTSYEAYLELYSKQVEQHPDRLFNAPMSEARLNAAVKRQKAEWAREGVTRKDAVKAVVRRTSQEVTGKQARALAYSVVKEISEDKGLKERLFEEIPELEMRRNRLRSEIRIDSKLQKKVFRGVDPDSLTKQEKNELIDGYIDRNLLKKELEKGLQSERMLRRHIFEVMPKKEVIDPITGEIITNAAGRRVYRPTWMHSPDTKQ